METQRRREGNKPSFKRRYRRGSLGLFHAESEYAESIFRKALGDIESAVSALRRALDHKPDYAPAIFSLGTFEYQRGKRAAGWALFESLLSLPSSTPDLCEVIDDAGSFFIQLPAHKEGLDLYRAAAARFPRVAVFHDGLACCAGHLGLHDEAVAASTRAVNLDPKNQEFVNSLGWSLLNAGKLQEAEETLVRAVSMDPADELARANLRYCKAKRSKAPSRKRRTRS